MVIRKLASGPDLLILLEPASGYQLPGGALIPGETTQHAVLRVVAEKTGLNTTVIDRVLHSEENNFPGNAAVILHPTTVFSHPDPSSFDWARLQSGTEVKILRKEIGYTQISYQVPDNPLSPSYTTYQITGWVPDEVLTQKQSHHYYLVIFSGSTPPNWKVNVDQTTYTAAWFPLADVPSLLPIQTVWLESLISHLANHLFPQS